jgi:hypothetical protein
MRGLNFFIPLSDQQLCAGVNKNWTGNLPVQFDLAEKKFLLTQQLPALTRGEIYTCILDM